MKLLFDENIYHRILKKVNIEYENTIHCKNINPNPKNDFDIWNYGKTNYFTIVTSDEDFYEWMLLIVYPPKIIWLRTRNTTTNNIAELIYLVKNLLRLRIFM
ncbi:MAG: DUF5615 family PIN-like protein [bacterium]